MTILPFSYWLAGTALVGLVRLFDGRRLTYRHERPCVEKYRDIYIHMYGRQA